MIKLFRQFVSIAQVVDALSNIPMLWRPNRFALHEAASRVFRIGQCLFNNGPVCVLKVFKNGFLLRFVKVLNKVNNIIRFQLANGYTQNIRAQNADHLFAQAFVEFRQNVAVKLAII